MPTYQYACTACDHRFDAVQSFSDSSLTECPACTGALRKVFSSVGIVFKGSGFYRTDSRAGAGSTVAKGESSGSANGSSANGSSASGGSANGKEPTGSSKERSKSKASASASSGSSSGSGGSPAAAAS